MSRYSFRCLLMAMLPIVVAPVGPSLGAAPAPPRSPAVASGMQAPEARPKEVQARDLAALTARVETLERQAESAVHSEVVAEHRAVMAIDLLISVVLIVGALIAFFGLRGLRDIRRMARRVRATRELADEEVRSLPSVDITEEIAPDLKTTLAELGRRLDLLEELGQPLEAADCIARGNAWYAQGDYRRAATWYDRAIAAKPDLADAYYRKGIALYQLADYEQALASLDRVIELSPDDAEPAYVKGLVLLRIGRCEDAVSSYSRAVTLSPGWPRPYLGRASAYARLGRTEECLADLASAVELDPGSRDGIAANPDFEEIRNDPEYGRLTNPAAPVKGP